MSERITRPALPRDATALGEAHAEEWAAAYTGLIDAEALATVVEHRRTSWVGFFASPRYAGATVLVSEIPSMLEGFALLLPSAERTGWIELRGFHFHPSAWGTGASVALMDAVFTKFASQPIHLWTHRDPPRAHGFYEKSGYGRTGEARDLDFGNGLVIPEVEYAGPSSG